MSSYDVLIVGGGPAGLSTALFALAADPGLADRIAVIEKGTHPRQKICAGAIGGRADKALASIGVSVDVPERLVTGVSVESPLGTLVSQRAEPIGRVIRRREFDAGLAAQARRRGVQLLEGHGVKGVEREAGRVRVTLSDGRVLQAKAVVGADGVDSTVRRALGISRKCFYAQAIEVDTPAGPDDPDPTLLHFDAADRSLRGYAWDFPTIVDGQPLVCRGIYALRGRLDGGEGPEDRGPNVKQRLLAHLEKRGVDPTGLRFKQFAERALTLHEPVAVPRIMLVGEAAGIDALLGEGIAQAVQYGQVAGPYLARCVETQTFDFTDWPKVFSASLVGRDLRVRGHLAGWIYDDARPLAERFITGSQTFADAGIHYFAGDRVRRRDLARAAVQLAGASLRGLPGLR